jgi:tRNA U55 pseudouridine synthase TruB
VELRRYRSGKFSLDRALSVEDLARLTEQGLVRRQILPLKEAVEVQGFIRVEEKTAALIRQGRPVRPSDLPEEERGWLMRRGRVGLLDGPDHLLAIGESMGSEGTSSTKNLPVLRILRVFNH